MPLKRSPGLASTPEFPGGFTPPKRREKSAFPGVPEPRSTSPVFLGLRKSLSRAPFWRVPHDLPTASLRPVETPISQRSFGISSRLIQVWALFLWCYTMAAHSLPPASTGRRRPRSNARGPTISGIPVSSANSRRPMPEPIEPAWSLRSLRNGMHCSVGSMTLGPMPNAQWRSCPAGRPPGSALRMC